VIRAYVSLALTLGDSRPVRVGLWPGAGLGALTLDFARRTRSPCWAPARRCGQLASAAEQAAERADDTGSS
jgi:hypothetical protein